MQRTYQLFFISLSIILFFVRISCAMDPVIKEGLFWESVKGHEKMLLERLYTRGEGFDSIKDTDDNLIASIDWRNDSFYTFCPDQETVLLNYRIKAAKKLLQLKVPIPRTQEMTESCVPCVEETMPLFASPALPHDKAESEYGHAVETLQRSYRKYFVGEDENTTNVRCSCWGCCLY